jgi:hypothetical protein
VVKERDSIAFLSTLDKLNMLAKRHRTNTSSTLQFSPESILERLIGLTPRRLIGLLPISVVHPRPRRPRPRLLYTSTDVLICQYTTGYVIFLVVVSCKFKFIQVELNFDL